MFRSGPVKDAVDENPSEPLPTPTHLRRVRGATGIFVLTAFLLETVARFIHGATEVPDVFTKFISFIALVLLCGTAMFLIFRLHHYRLLRGMVLMGGGLLLITQGLSVLLETEMAQVGVLWEWARRSESLLILTGVVMLLATFYFALIEMVVVKASLQREQIRLRSEIGERLRAEEQLRASRDKLRDLTAHVERIRESERSRIARELHDELGQDLTCLKIDTERLNRLLSRSDANAVSQQDILESMKRQIDEMVKITRRMVRELHPAILDDLGLHAALEWLVDDFQSRTQIACTTDFRDEEFEVSKDTATAVFRIAQECLTNVARHAQADAVSIKFFRLNGSIKLEVSDNGRGISVKSPSGDTHGFGILGMRERVMLLGGEFVLEPAVNGGTRVEVTVPGANSATGTAQD